MNEPCTDVIVVGAGISGLVAAYRCVQHGLGVEVFEAAARAGGVIGTRRRDGALFELGPNSTLDTTPLIDSLLDSLGIRDQRVDASAIASRRFIVRGGALVALPTSPGAFLTTRAFSLRAKLRLAREPFVAAAPAEVEESIADFVRRRLGREFLDYAIDPFVAGIYAGDPERISVPAAFPRLHALEQRYGSLIRGQIGGRKERARDAEKAKNTAGSFSFRQGMQTLTDALAAHVPRLHGAAPVLSITRQTDGTFQVAARQGGASVRRNARAVVVAVPADSAAQLAMPHDAAAATALARIEYAPVCAIASCYARSAVRHPLDGFGFLVPKVENRSILGTLFSSSMFAGRARDDEVLLTTFAGGRRNPEIAASGDRELAGTVATELAQLVGASGPRWCEITRWRRAIPQYDLGHGERVAAVEALEQRVPGLWWRANYRGGVSVGDCIKSAHATADAVATFLRA